jgi:general secretion pathway protein L
VQRILGIDLGATAVKVVAIESSFRSHTVAAYRAEPIAPDDETAPRSYADRLKPALEALAQDEWFRADTIICSLPAAQVATHMITLPFTETKKIEATLPNEVEDLIPSNLDEVVFDWHILSRAPGKTEVLVSVTAKREVQAVLDALKTVNVDPSIVTFSAAALTHLFAENYIEQADATPEAPATCEAIIDIGAERTNIAIAEGGQFRFARTFSPGSLAVTRALARGLSLSVEQAEELKQSFGVALESDPTLVAVMDRAMSALLREIRATFASYSARSKRKVERVTLCGGGARLAGLDLLLGETLNVSVQPLKIREQVAFPEGAELDRGTLALSLGLRGVSSGRGPRLDFRKGELAFTKNAGETRSVYLSLAAMAAVLVVLLGASMWAKLHLLSTRESKLDEQLCEVTKKILGTCETDFRVAIGRLKGRGSPAASIPTYSAADVLIALGASFPPGNDSVLSDLDIVDGTVHMRGDAKGYEAVDELSSGLQAHRCLKDVKKKTSKGKDGRVEFSADLTYDCTNTRKAGS